MPKKLPTTKVRTENTEIVETGASVYVSTSFTKNMGNYNSAKYEVGVTLPVNPSKKLLADVNDTIDTAVEIVTKELEKQLKELEG